MGRGILKAVAEVFPDAPDFICHFHFLRDIGKDFMETEYNIIRTRLKKHQIAAKLRYRAKQLKTAADLNPCKTGNAASSRMLRAILAETPLVRNLQNPDYMKILLNGKSAIEDVFAEIEIDVLRREFRKAQSAPEKSLPSSNL